MNYDNTVNVNVSVSDPACPLTTYSTVSHMYVMPVPTSLPVVNSNSYFPTTSGEVNKIDPLVPLSDKFRKRTSQSPPEIRISSLSNIPEDVPPVSLEANVGLIFAPTNVSNSFQNNATANPGGKSTHTISKLGKEAVYAAFTSSGSLIIGNNANHTVVKQNGGKSKTNTTVSLRDKNTPISYNVTSGALHTGKSPLNNNHQNTGFMSAPSTEESLSQYSNLPSGSNLQVPMVTTEKTFSKHKQQSKNKYAASCQRKNQTGTLGSNLENPWFTTSNQDEKFVNSYKGNITSTQNQKNQHRNGKYSSVQSNKSLQHNHKEPPVTDIHGSYEHLPCSCDKMKKTVPEKELHPLSEQHQSSLSLPVFNSMPAHHRKTKEN